MADDRADQPLPEEAYESNLQRAQPSGDDGFDRNDVTVILSDDDIASAEEVTDTATDVTEAVPLRPTDVSGNDDVFVLLSDKDEQTIPLVDVDELVDTESVPLVDSVPVGDADTGVVAGVDELDTDQIGVDATETMEPRGFGDEIEHLDAEMTEQCDVAEEPTDPIGAADLDAFASSVGDQETADDITGEDAGDLADGDLEDLEYTVSDAQAHRGGSAKWLGVAAALLIGGGAVAYFFPEYVGLGSAPSTAVAASSSAGVDNNSTPDVAVAVVEDPLDERIAVAAAQDAFRRRYRVVVELGFAGEVK